MFRIDFGKLAAITLAAFAPMEVRADVMTLVTDPATQHATDMVDWSEAGAADSPLQAAFGVPSRAGLRIDVLLAAAGAVTADVCPSANCGWRGAGFTAGERLLWASDNANGGTGPVRMTFPAGVQGAGALVQPNVPGSFTARIEAFNNTTPLGFYTVVSAGAAAYIGIADGTGPNITSVVFSLTQCADSCADFSIGTVQFNAGPPRVTASPASVAFGRQPVNQTSGARAVTLTNTGLVPVSLGISVQAPFSETHNCGATLPYEASCTVWVSFTPKSVGTQNGALSLGTGLPALPLSGEGFIPAPAQLTVSTALLNFGDQPITSPSAPQNVTLTNIGDLPAPLNISASNFFTVNHSCPASLAGKSSCIISVAFAPTDIGARYSMLVTGDPRATVSLSGFGIDPPRSGLLTTDDRADSLSWRYERGVAALGTVEIRLCQAVPLDWRKAIAVGGPNIYYVDIEVYGSNCVSQNINLKYVQPNVKIEFWKARFLGIPALVKVRTLGEFFPLGSGSRLTFTWLKD